MTDFALEFDTSEKSIIESAFIVKEFVPFLEEMKMYYYFPFSEVNESVIQAQIKEDSITFKLAEAENNIKEAWEEYVPAIISKLSTVADTSTVSAYRCVLTFYGPYGYYYTPDTVYVNITKGTPDEWIETLLHELLHLLFFEKIAGMEHLEEEWFIDSTFIELFGDIFPNYKIQNE